MKVSKKELMFWIIIILAYIFIQNLFVYMYTSRLVLHPFLFLLILLIVLDLIINGSFIERFNLRINLKYLMYGIITTFILFICIFIVNLIAVSIFGHQTIENVENKIFKSPEIHTHNNIVLTVFQKLIKFTGQFSIIIIIFILLIVAIVEEIIFRGIILEDIYKILSIKLNENFAKSLAIIFQGILFTYLHLTSWNFSYFSSTELSIVLILIILPLFLISIIFSIARLYTKSLMVPIISHFIYDFVVLIITFLKYIK